MDLFRDCLDQQIVDRNDRRIGRVDGIILEVEPNRPPRVAYVEVGVVTLADRVSPSLRARMIQLMKRLGIQSDRFQIPWGKIRVGVNEVIADIVAEETTVMELELWLRKKIIGRIPGA
jgi:hypothetical protein